MEKRLERERQKIVEFSKKDKEHLEKYPYELEQVEMVQAKVSE